MHALNGTDKESCETLSSQKSPPENFIANPINSQITNFESEKGFCTSLSPIYPSTPTGVRVCQLSEERKINTFATVFSFYFNSVITFLVRIF